MAKCMGYVGYVITEETAVDVWEKKPIEKPHKMVINRFSRRNSADSDSVNGKVTLNTQVNIVANPFVLDNFQYINYVKIKGVAWEVTNVEPAFPEVVLTLGGVYNGEIKE